MRNLKKILALVLAMMMVLSMMVTANAAFVDADDITGKYTEAVELLTGLGVIDGVKNADDTVSFNPKDTLNRAAAAKIISYILEGSLDGIDAVVDSVSNPFNDLPSWAEPYVLYAYAQGIVVGDGNGSYAPKRELTGYEFGKMLLIAAGICDNDDFAKDWKTVVATELKDNGLWTGKDFALSKKLTREEACYLAFNAILFAPEGDAYTVEDTDGEIYYFTDKNEAARFNKEIGGLGVETVQTKSLYTDVFGGKISTGVVIANGENDLTCNAYGMTVLSNGLSVFMDTGLDMIGHSAKVYYYTYKGYDYAYSYVDKATKVEEVSFVPTSAVPGSNNDLSNLLTKAGFKKDTLTTKAKYAENYVLGSTSYTDQLEYAFSNFIAISNSSNKQVDYIINITRSVDAIQSITPKKMSDGSTVSSFLMKNEGVLKSTEIITSDILAADDLVYITEIGDIYYVEKAEVLTGVFTGITSTLGVLHSYNIGGESYTFDLQVTGTVKEYSYLDAAMANADAGNTYAFVLDDFGYIAAIRLVEGSASSEYVYVAAFGQTSATDAMGNTGTAKLTALIYHVDGTSEIVKLDTTSGAFNGLTVANILKYQKGGEQDKTGVYEITKDTYGVYTMKAPGEGNEAGSEIKSNSAKVSANIFGTDDMIVFFVGGTYNADRADFGLNVTAVKGIDSLVGYTLDKVYYETDINSNKLAVVALENAAYAGVAANDIYYNTGLFIRNYDSATKTYSDTYILYKDGEVAYLTYTYATTEAANAAYVAAGFVTPGATGLVDYTNGLENQVVAGAYKNNYTLSDGETVVIDENTKIYDMTDGELFTSFDVYKTTTVEVQVLYSTTNGVNYANVIYVTLVGNNDAKLDKDTATVTTTDTAKKTAVYTIAVDTDTVTVTKTGEGTKALNINGLASALGLPEGATVYFDTTDHNDLESLLDDESNAINIYDVTAAVQNKVVESGYLYVVAEDGMTMVKYTLSI